MLTLAFVIVFAMCLAEGQIAAGFVALLLAFMFSRTQLVRRRPPGPPRLPWWRGG